MLMLNLIDHGIYILFAVNDHVSLSSRASRLLFLLTRWTDFDFDFIPHGSHPCQYFYLLAISTYRLISRVGFTGLPATRSLWYSGDTNYWGWNRRAIGLGTLDHVSAFRLRIFKIQLSIANYLTSASRIFNKADKHRNSLCYRKST